MDIDIDFASRDKALRLFNYIAASRIDDAVLVRHTTGVYFQSVPVDPKKNISIIPYTDDSMAAVFKIDFLNLSIYNTVRDEAHLNKLMNTEPLWELLEQAEFSDLLFQVKGHSEILCKMKPVSISQLAAVLAIIRPAKRHLIGQSWDIINKEIWAPAADPSAYAFKKSHSFAYATAIVVHMNLIVEQTQARVLF